MVGFSSPMAIIEKFGQFEVARSADGQMIELPRSSGEMVLIAFDVCLKRLVELHVIKAASKFNAQDKNALLELVKIARETANGSFMRILDIGEDDGVPYYSTSLNDGEFLEDYILRRGALPAATAFSLLLPLLDDLIALQKHPELAASLSLTRIQIGLLEDTFLHLKGLDFGFCTQVKNDDSSLPGGRLVRECCATLFLMLVGKASAGEDCDQYQALSGLPTILRMMMRSSLSMSDNAPSSIQRFRDYVREALGVITRELGQRAARRHLVTTDAMLPQSALRQILLQNLPLEQILKSQHLIGDVFRQQRYPFTIHASDVRTEAPVTVHLLPPKRIVASEHYDAVPLQMWRFSAEKHPNIIRSLSVWESPDLTFLTEARGTGFPLSLLIANRVYLNPPEVLILMRQVKRGIDQALECGVDRLDLHPSNIELRLGGQTLARELDKLMQRRLDAWPKFLVMLRPHMTMRGLHEPLMVDIASDAEIDEALAAKDFRNRSFIALAAYLLSGKQQALRAQPLPDSVPADLAAFMQEMLLRGRTAGSAPSPAEFLSELEKRTTVSEVEQENGAVNLPARSSLSRPLIDTGNLESAGAVSDFDEDLEEESALKRYAPSGRSSVAKNNLLNLATIKNHKLAPKGSVAVWLWAAGVVFAVLLVFNWFTGSGKQKGNESLSAKGEKGLAPVEVRKAQMLSDSEREELRKSRNSAVLPKPSSEPGDDPEATVVSTARDTGVARP
jgi:serine/threonine protein kinase